MNRRRRSPGICFEGNPPTMISEPSDDRWRRSSYGNQEYSFTWIATSTIIASKDRPTMIAVRKPQLKGSVVMKRLITLGLVCLGTSSPLQISIVARFVILKVAVAFDSGL